MISPILFVANVAVCIWSYSLGNYKTAIFNGFAAGFCFYGAF